MFASEDGGDHWRQLGLDGIEARGFLRLSNGDILCTGRLNGLFHSTDGGETWPAEDATVKHDLKAVAVTESGTAYTVGSWGVILMSAPTGVASK